MKMLAASFTILLSLVLFTCSGYNDSSHDDVDDYFQYQDYLNQINILPAWQKTKGAGVKVMVFDDGVQASHEDLANISIWNVKDEGSSAEPTDMTDYSHGTEISGLIAAQENGKGIIGVAPECDFLFIGDPTAYFSDADVIKAFAYAISRNVKIISCSWGSYAASSTFESLVELCHSYGITMFFAAGNDGYNMDIPQNDPSYWEGDIHDESELPWVIGVSSSNAEGNRAEFSNYGENIDIMAPGENLLTLDLMGADGENKGYPANNNYNYVEGTSYSTPIAAGVAALMLSVNPALTPEEIRIILTETATKSGDDYDSDGFSLEKAYGLINAGLAVEKAAEMLSQ
jgi:subtilisin family serine protease